ncbi:rhodanese-like domain-containing protein [Rubrobacter tropicus]|uniref:Rhodanese-like domain-containing protein n=1 Tax=Rubrobacter tropicus TaxID=2653851 RepID=A0A6G8QFR1_9ACTN|nr:rhodanese-like domain-containing protein [Rubrobacter tropicus]
MAFALLVFGCGTPDTPSAGSEGGSGGDGVARNTAGSSASGAGEKVAVADGSYTRLSPEELRDALRGGDLLLVNTHVPFAGDITGTDLSIPYDEIEGNLERLPADKGARIAVYCRSGSMSASAAETLVGLGYENVWDLAGGMEAWEAAGFRLEGA